MDGCIVPIRDGEAITGKIELLAGDPDLLSRMAGNAQNRAQEFSWEKYGDRLISIIKIIMSPK